MKHYGYATRFEPAERAALKASARQTRQSINQLIVSCVRRALPEVTAELSRGGGRITNVEPLPKKVLDQEDGLETLTRCQCDLMFTVEKSALKRKRGEVVWERRRDISRKMIQGLAIAGM